MAQQRHGNLNWRDVTAPAATLARSFVISTALGRYLEAEKESIQSGLYPALAALYLKEDGSLKKAGDIVANIALSTTLTRIGQQGPDYLYTEMASTLAAEIATAGIVHTVYMLYILYALYTL